MENEDSIQQGVNIPSCMTIGTEFVKINSSKNGVKGRLLRYDSMLQRIVWKSKKLGVIQLEWITSIKKGADIKAFPNVSLQELPETRLAIHYSHKSNDKMLLLVAPSPAIANDWYRTLDELVNSAAENSFKAIQSKGKDSMDKSLDEWLKMHWAVIDKNKDGKVDIKEFNYFIKLINIECSDQDSKVIFKRVDTAGLGYLDYEGIKKVYYILQTRPEVQSLFKETAKANEGIGITFKEFYRFLTSCQGENISFERAQELFDQYGEKNQFGLSKDQFLRYLLSSDNKPLRGIEADPLQDMDQPLSHYWINSSHNTYLTGNQLVGTSSIHMYEEVLKKGCRCVELDCWDGPNDEPIIYHGYTLTSKILFKDVVQSVKDHAFRASPYPVILSLEVHCSVAQQDVMAAHLRNILGDMLVTTRIEDLTSNPLDFRLPSPNQLLYKIILKGKALESPLKQVTRSLSNGTSKPINGEPENILGQSTESFVDEPGMIDDGNESPTKSGKSSKVSAALSEITPYCQTGKFINHQHARTNMKYFQMSSFSENALFKAYDSAANARVVTRDFVWHNERCLSRSYPAGKRVDSSNYNPLSFWLAGFQMVALNFQIYDLGYQLNASLFRQNRKCGYVLKPEYMRQPNQYKCELKPKKYYLYVRVISAQNLPKPYDQITGEVIDPFIEVEAVSYEYGTKFGKGNECVESGPGVVNMRDFIVSSNSSMEELSPVVVRCSQKTEVVTDNGFNPRWSSLFVFMFSNPELTFLRFTVHEFNKRTTNDKIGSYCVRLPDLKPGYRHIPVYNNSGNGAQYPFASLFISTSLEEQDDPNVLLRPRGGNVPTAASETFPQPLAEPLSSSPPQFSSQPQHPPSPYSQSLSSPLTNGSNGHGRARSVSTGCLLGQINPSSSVGIPTSLKPTLVSPHNNSPSFGINNSPPYTYYLSDPSHPSNLQAAQV